MMENSVIARALAQGRRRPDAAAYRSFDGQAWRTTSWGEISDQILQFARALIDLGVAPGDTVGILSSNRVEWVTVFHGALAAGAIPFGIYTSAPAPDVARLLSHSGARVLVVENADQYAKVAGVRSTTPALAHVIGLAEGAGDHSWANLLAGATAPQSAVEARLASIEPGQVASLVYTSGTTGAPKAAMLSHGSLSWLTDAVMKLCPLAEGEPFVSYLPLANLTEQTNTVLVAPSAGLVGTFVDRPERTLEVLKEVQPPNFLGVPLVWERMKRGIEERAATASVLQRVMLNVATRASRPAARSRAAGQAIGVFAELADHMVSRVVMDKVRRALGLGQARLCFTGGAPIDPGVLEFFEGLGVVVYEVYGMTEAGGIVAVSRPGERLIGTVGKPPEGMEIRLAADGEVQVRSPALFLGYYKDPDATREVLQDGWLSTGDVGEWAPGGYLRLVGRKKDILITSTGRNVAPAKIEHAIERSALVGQALVIGDRRPHLAALLTLNAEAAQQIAGKIDRAHEHPAILAALRRHVGEVNQTLPRPDVVRRFAVLPEPFRIECGELTPTLKLKRGAIVARHVELIEQLYAARRTAGAIVVLDAPGEG